MQLPNTLEVLVREGSTVVKFVMCLCECENVCVFVKLTPLGEEGHSILEES